MNDPCLLPGLNLSTQFLNELGIRVKQHPDAQIRSVLRRAWVKLGTYQGSPLLVLLAAAGDAKELTHAATDLKHQFEALTGSGSHLAIYAVSSETLSCLYFNQGFTAVSTHHEYPIPTYKPNSGHLLTPGF